VACTWAHRATSLSHDTYPQASGQRAWLSMQPTTPACLATTMRAPRATWPTRANGRRPVACSLSRIRDAPSATSLTVTAAHATARNAPGAGGCDKNGRNVRIPQLLYPVWVVETAEARKPQPQLEVGAGKLQRPNPPTHVNCRCCPSSSAVEVNQRTTPNKSTDTHGTGNE
jgi:hypothetical protein